jgi:inhibitor of KinA
MEPTPPYEIFALGDQAVTISLGNKIERITHIKAIAIRDWLLQHPFEGMRDVIVAYSSLTIQYDFLAVKKMSGESPNNFVSKKLGLAYERAVPGQSESSRLCKIPVCYDEEFAVDLPFISQHTGLSRTEVIALHISIVYDVYMIGFLPGFPYMAEVDQRLALPRKEKPSMRIEAGSVGIAGVQTGIYPVASPGGWQIIGRTALTLFNQSRNPPVLLEAGDRVQFYTIDKKEFYELKNSEL